MSSLNLPQKINTKMISDLLSSSSFTQKSCECCKNSENRFTNLKLKTEAHTLPFIKVSPLSDWSKLSRVSQTRKKSFCFLWSSSLYKATSDRKRSSPAALQKKTYPIASGNSTLPKIYALFAPFLYFCKIWEILLDSVARPFKTVASNAYQLKLSGRRKEEKGCATVQE